MPDTGDTTTCMGSDLDCRYEDSKGRYWFAAEGDSNTLGVGTIDAGLWQYKEQQLSNVVLLNKAIWLLYKDRKGLIWGLQMEKKYTT